MTWNEVRERIEEMSETQRATGVTIDVNGFRQPITEIKHATGSEGDGLEENQPYFVQGKPI